MRSQGIKENQTKMGGAPQHWESRRRENCKTDPDGEGKQGEHGPQTWKVKRWVCKEEELS